MRGLSKAAIVFLTVVAVSCSRAAEPAAAAAPAPVPDQQKPAGPPPSAAAPEPAPVQRQGRWIADVKPLSLNEITEIAERIFVGTVQEVQLKNVKLTENDRSVEAPVRDVVLRVDEGIKGTKTGETLVVRQLVSASAALKAGEQVVWYLPKPSHLGLSQPVGVFSGDFRIASTESGRVVQNLRGNVGLWSGSVWDDGFDRNQVMIAARDSNLDFRRVDAIEKAAAVDPAAQPMPLDLLLLLTRNLAKQ